MLVGMRRRITLAAMCAGMEDVGRWRSIVGLWDGMARAMCGVLEGTTASEDWQVETMR